MATPSAFELSNEQYLVATHHIASTVADVAFWTAPIDCTVVAIHEVHGTKGTDNSAVTGTIRRCQGTEAADAGDDLLGTTKFDFKGDNLTLQSPALTSTAAHLNLSAGDRLALDVTGTTTALANVILTVLLKRV